MALAGVYNKGGASHSQGTLLRLGKRDGNTELRNSKELQQDSVSDMVAGSNTNASPEHVSPSRSERSIGQLSVGLLLETLRDMVENQRRVHEFDTLKRSAAKSLDALGK